MINSHHLPDSLDLETSTSTSTSSLDRVNNIILDQINLASRTLALAATELYIAEEAPDILAISDPPHYLRFNQYRTSNHIWMPSPGVSQSLCGFFVRADLDIEVVPLPAKSNRVTAAILHSPSGDIGLISFYVQHTTALGLEAVSEAVRLLHRRCPRLLLAGDGNGHSRIWGKEDSNEVGLQWEDLLLSHNLTVLNDPEGSPTFVDAQDRPHWLDLTIGSASILAQIHRWTVRPSAFPESDHNLVRTVISAPKSQIQQRRSYNWAAVDWNAFNAQLYVELQARRCFTPITTSWEVEARVIALTEAYQTVMTDQVRLSKHPGFKKPWFTAHVKSKWRLFRRARNRFLKLKTKHARGVIQEHVLQEAMIQLSTTRRTFKEAVKDEKTNCFRRFCSSLKSDGEMWSAFKRIAGGYKTFSVPALQTSTGITQTNSEKAAALFDRFFPREDSNPSILHQQATDWRTTWTTPAWTTGADAAQTDISELHTIVSSTRNSAPGCDQIPMLCIQKTFCVTGHLLTNLYNLCFSHSYFPKRWRRSTVLPIPKKGDQSLKPSAWRPISLLCCFGKLLEKLMQKRLRSYLESQSRLSPQQFGFRPQRGTIAALVRLNEDIICQFNKRRQVLALSLDLSSAFDMVPHDILLWRLHQFGVSPALIKIIAAFLAERCADLCIGSTTFRAAPSRGVPQGSPLSPTLFTCFIDSLAREISEPVHISMFADDCLLYAPMNRALTTLNSFQSAVHRVEAWASENHMQFNISKSHLVRFSRLRGAPPAHIYMDGTKLEEEDSFRYLGLTMDRKLNFRRHATEARGKAFHRLLQIRRLSSSQWGAAPWVSLILVRACVVPALLYGVEIWMASGLAENDKLKKITHAYRRGSLMITGAFRTTSTDALIALSGLRPPRQELRLRQLRLRRQLSCLEPLPAPHQGTYTSPLAAMHASLMLTPEKDVERALDIQHTTYWEQSPNGRLLQAAGWNPVLARKQRWIKNMDRRSLTALSRLLSGHFPCKVYLRRFGLLDEAASTTCRLCQEAPESRDHFQSCPALTETRLRLFGTPTVSWPHLLCRPVTRLQLAAFASELCTLLRTD